MGKSSGEKFSNVFITISSKSWTFEFFGLKINNLTFSRWKNSVFQKDVVINRKETNSGKKGRNFPWLRSLLLHVWITIWRRSRFPPPPLVSAPLPSWRAFSFFFCFRNFPHYSYNTNNNNNNFNFENLLFFPEMVRGRFGIVQNYVRLLHVYRASLSFNVASDDSFVYLVDRSVLLPGRTRDPPRLQWSRGQFFTQHHRSRQFPGNGSCFRCKFRRIVARNRFAPSASSFSVSANRIQLNSISFQVGLGWAGDQPWMNVTKTYAACLTLCGLTCIFMPLTTDRYNVLAALSALFGLFFASNYSFTPSIVVQLIPLERFTTAYGLILLCQGIGCLVGPPLAGDFNHF